MKLAYEARLRKQLEARKRALLLKRRAAAARRRAAMRAKARESSLDAEDVQEILEEDVLPWEEDTTTINSVEKVEEVLFAELSEVANEVKLRTGVKE